jgi:hypothetical protein
MHIKYFLFFIISVILFIPSYLVAQYYIPPYESVYEDLRYLQTYGFLRELNFSQLPIIDTELLRFVDKERGEIAGDITKTMQLNILDKVFRSYSLDGEKSSVSKEVIPLYIGSVLDVSLNNEDDLELLPRIRTFAMLSLPFGISCVNIMNIDPKAPEDPNYIGKEWRGIAGYTEQAYLMWRAKFLRVTAGRSYLVNGLDRKGSLIFSPVGRPMDNFRMEFSLGKINFQFMVAQLDKMGDMNRYLSSHRLGFKSTNFQISINESILYSGENRSLEFPYINPFIFFHIVQLNGPNMSGNTLGSVDFRFLGNRWSIYGQLLIDDIQLDNEVPGDLEPNEVGGTLGLDFTDIFNIDGIYIGCEYTAITNRTYKTPSESEWYIHRNVPIGYPLGSDLDRFNLRMKKYLKSWNVSFEYDFIRKGEGEMDVPWDSPWLEYTVEEGYDEPFPTGIIEYTNNFSIGVEWQPSYKKYIYLVASYSTIENYEHTDDYKSDFTFILGCWFDIKWAINI